MKTGRHDWPPAVVIGLNAAGLSVARSLGRRGIGVIGYTNKPLSVYSRSRYIVKRVFQQPLYDRPLIESLIACGKTFRGDFPALFCATDESVLTVSRYAQELRPYYRFVAPDYGVSLTQISKTRFHAFAVANSFPVPETHFSGSIDDIKVISSKIAFPCIVKPELKYSAWDHKIPEKKVLLLNSADALISEVQRYGIQNTPLVIQEWIEGDDTDLYFCLTYIDHQKRPLGWFTGRKLRQDPHLAGTLSIAESVSIQVVTDLSLQLLKAAGCVGICSVELKQSKRNGAFYIMEPTVGRPDSQEGFCVQAGLDIPYLAYLDALFEELSCHSNIPPGLKWIDEERFYYTVREVFKGTISLRQLVRLINGKRYYSIFALDDPIPGLAFLFGKFLKLTNKLAKLFC